MTLLTLLYIISRLSIDDDTKGRNIIEYIATTALMKYFALCDFCSRVIYGYNKFTQEKEERGQSRSLCCKSLIPTDDIVFLRSLTAVTGRSGDALHKRRDIKAVLMMIERMV